MNQMTEEAQRRADDLREGVEDMTQQANRVAQDFKTKARDWGLQADHYVHEYAYTSLITAALIGCAVGFLLGNSRR